MASYGSDLWSSSQPQSSQAQKTFARDTIPIPSMNRHNHLLSFLAIAQIYVIEFLHELWDRDLGPIGFGASAEVRTKFVSDFKDFAFKRHRASGLSSVSLKPDCNLDDYNEYLSNNESVYNALVSELTVLSHPSIRYHQNFVQLEGICWETSSDGKEIWPVLVLEKANLGDMWNFGQSPEGRQLSLKDRLLLCLDVATALSTLHENGIVHGDVKPQNVLIFQEIKQNLQKGLIYAKVSDFGFAGWDMDHSAQDLIYLPRSKPWYGPEYHHRAFSIQQAMQLDIYSYGMLCFWFLFHDKSVKGDSSFPQRVNPCQSPNFQWQDSTSAWIEQMEQLKHGGHMLSLVRDFVKIELSLDSTGKNDLEEFFSYALAQNPQQREIRLDRLSTLTGLKAIQSPKGELISTTSLDHALYGFRVADSYNSLMRSKYKTIQHIASCLKMQAMYAAHETSRGNAAFQYGICCKIGFGVPASDIEAHFWLHASGKSEQDWTNELSELKQFVQARSTYRDGDLMLMLSHDLIELQDRWSECNKSDGEIFQKELDGVVKCFGSNNFLVLYLKTDLVRLARLQHRFEDAERLAIQVLEEEVDNPMWTETRQPLSAQALAKRDLRNRERFGPLVLKRPASSLESPEFARISNLVKNSRAEIGIPLANIYISQGRLKEAELILIDAFEAVSLYATEDNSQFFRHIQEIAYLYYRVERYSDAERLFRYVCDASEHYLGKQHPHTRRLQDCLGCSYIAIKNHPAAEALFLELQSQYAHTYKSFSSKTLKNDMRLALSHRLAGLYDEAERIQLKVCQALNDFPNQSDVRRIDCDWELTEIYCMQCRYVEAESLLSRNIEEFERVFGGSSWKFRCSIYNLMLIRKLQHRWEEANTANMRYLLSYKGREKTDPVRRGANGHRAFILTMQHQYLEAAPYLLGLVPWPNGHWTHELIYFEVSAVKDRENSMMLSEPRNLLLHFVATLLFLGYWSGLLFLMCLVFDLPIEGTIRALKNQMQKWKAGKVMKNFAKHKNA